MPPRTASAASSSSPTTPTCSSTRATRRRRGARPTRPSAGPISRSSPAARDRPLERRPHLADGGAPAHAAGRGRAGAGRHGAGGHRGHVPPAGVRGRDDRRPVHPGRHEPVQRLFGRAAGRRRRRPAGAGAGDRGRARATAPGADRDLRGVRRGRAGRLVPDRGGRLGAAGGRRRLDPRRRALHRRPAAVRLRGARGGVCVPFLRRRGGRRFLLRPGGAARVGAVRAGRAGGPAGGGDPRGQQRPRPGDRPAGRQTHARRAPRALARAGPLWGDGLRRVPQRAGAVAGRRGLGRAEGDAGLAGAAACRADRADRAQPDRRAVAERRARPDRPTTAGVLRAVVGRVVGELMRLEGQPLVLARREPLHAAWGVLRERELLEVRLHGDDEVVGIGEAAPLESYDGVSLAAVRAALDAYGQVLAAHGEAPLEDLLEACRAERDLPQALAAVDLALWDLAGKRAGRPVAELISVEAARSIPVNAPTGAEARAGGAAAAAAAAQADFDTIKVKVGIGDDAGRLAAVRAAVGPRVAIRVDANGAWEIDEAVASLRALAPVGIELAEEPVHGVEALRAVRAEVDVPLAMDETAAEDGAAGSGATDAVCLKIARCGGITGVLRDAAEARIAGSVVYLASSYDGPLGIAAAVHAAAGLTAGGPLPE